MQNRVNQCAHIKDDGSRCRAIALKGSNLCFYHNPASADAHREATRKGAHIRNARRSHPWTDAYFTLIHGARNHGPVLLSPLLDAFLKVREGTMDTRTANSLAYLATVIAQMDPPPAPTTGQPKTHLQIAMPRWEAVMRQCLDWRGPRVQKIMREMNIPAPLPPDDPRMHELLARLYPPSVFPRWSRASSPTGSHRDPAETRDGDEDNGDDYEDDNNAPENEDEEDAENKNQP